MVRLANVCGSAAEGAHLASASDALHDAEDHLDAIALG
jgi:hypothetical protein